MRSQVVAGRERHMRGWKRDLPDHRDQVAPPMRGVTLPASAGPRQWRPLRKDQGDVGSCTGESTSGACELLRNKAGLPPGSLSGLFNYFCSRVRIEGGSPAEDGGAQLRDAVKAAAQIGIAPEAGDGAWPYDTTKFADEPPPVSFEAALHRRLLRYNSCPDLAAVKTMLALGYPVLFGFSVPENMMSPECAESGVVLFPESGERFVGGHAVFADWYDDTMVIAGETDPGALLVVNSWGEGWGLSGDDAGCFWLPYRFFTAGPEGEPLKPGEQSLADDAWAPRLESAA